MSGFDEEGRKKFIEAINQRFLQMQPPITLEEILEKQSDKQIQEIRSLRKDHQDSDKKNRCIQIVIAILAFIGIIISLIALYFSLAT